MDESLELLKEINEHLKNHTKLLDTLATKNDLEEVKSELREEIQEVRCELKADIEDVKDDIQDIKDDIQIVKDSMTTLFDICKEIKEKVSEHDEIIIKRVK